MKPETKFFTMGQVHEHHIPGFECIDKDTVVKLTNHHPEKNCRELAFDIFGEKFAREYDGKPDMNFYPKGIVEITYTEEGTIHKGAKNA